FLASPTRTNITKTSLQDGHPLIALRQRSVLKIKLTKHLYIFTNKTPLLIPKRLTVVGPRTSRYGKSFFRPQPPRSIVVLLAPQRNTPHPHNTLYNTCVLGL